MTDNRKMLHRRAFLSSAGRAGNALAATKVLRASQGILASGAALLPARARAQTGDMLVQPPEIRSRNGVLDATLVAGPGMVRLGNVTFPGFLYNNAYLPPLLRAR